MYKVTFKHVNVQVHAAVTNRMRREGTCTCTLYAYMYHNRNKMVVLLVYDTGHLSPTAKTALYSSYDSGSYCICNVSPYHGHNRDYVTLI